MQPFMVIVGSTNTDMVVKTDHLPAPGETVLGGTFLMNPGGKGANQAVAAARLGGAVTFISKTGTDIFGERSRQLLQEEGINTDFLITDPDNPSGVALITVDKNGENCIAVASGANAALIVSDVEKAQEAILQSSLVLLQLEIPLETVAFTAALAKRNGIPVVLNPAPACPLPSSLLQTVSIITPNKKEAEMLTGISINSEASLREAAWVLRQQGVETVVITLGAGGAYICAKDVERLIAAPVVQAVDTTAAGDVFNGALAVALAGGTELEEAVGFACSAAALSVTKMGAQASAPTRAEVQAFLQARQREVPASKQFG